jgi:hypothetical protein
MPYGPKMKESLLYPFQAVAHQVTSESHRSPQNCDAGKRQGASASSPNAGDLRACGGRFIEFCVGG